MNTKDKAYSRSSSGQVKRLLTWLFKLRGSPEAIARGVAIGLFVAVSPTPGFQIVIAAALATLLGANRPAAVAMVWITNPVTIVPVYLFTYRVGTLFLPGPPARRVSRQLERTAEAIENAGPLSMGEHLTALLNTGEQTVMPLLVGGLVVGATLAMLAYPLTLVVLRKLPHHRRTGAGAID